MDELPRKGHSVTYDNSKHYQINIRPRDAVMAIVLVALLNGLFGAVFTWLLQRATPQPPPQLMRYSFRLPPQSHRQLSVPAGRLALSDQLLCCSGLASSLVALPVARTNAA